MDNKKRLELIQEIERQGSVNDYAARSPAVSVEAFFDGNDDLGSIGCNIPNDEHPGLHKFNEVLRKINKRKDVQCVLIKIYDIEEGAWPFSDEVYILSSASLGEVREWIEELCPSNVYDDLTRNDGKTWKAIKPHNGPELQEGMKAYYIWWD
jgi:hypothetical protein